MKTLEANAPTKIKIVRGNNKPRMNRTLRRAIMKRSTLSDKIILVEDNKILSSEAEVEECFTGYFN